MLLRDCIFSSKEFHNFTPHRLCRSVYNWLPKIVEYPQHRLHGYNDGMFHVLRQQIVFGIVQFILISALPNH